LFATRSSRVELPSPEIREAENVLDMERRPKDVREGFTGVCEEFLLRVSPEITASGLSSRLS
jgi:hypothetical protein